VWSAAGVSNGLLQQWPKVHSTRDAVTQLLQDHTHWQGACVATRLRHLSSRCVCISTHELLNLLPGGCISVAGAAVAVACAEDGLHWQHERGALPWPVSGRPLLPPPWPHDVNPALFPVAIADGGDLPWGQLFNVMSNTSKVDDPCQLPLTGVGKETDHYLSSAFVEQGDAFTAGHPYGTRSQTLMAVWRDGRMQLRERYVEQGEAGAWMWRSTEHDTELHHDVLQAVDSRQREGAAQCPTTPTIGTLHESVC
jgi:hypothetical protein